MGTRHDYGYAVRKAVSDYVETVKDVSLLTEWMTKNMDGYRWRLNGAPKLFEILWRCREGTAPKFPMRRCAYPRMFVNAINALIFLCGGMLWLAFRTRFRTAAPEEILLAAERTDFNDIHMFEEVLDDPRDLLIVDRSPFMAQKFKDYDGRWRTCFVDDARIDLASFIPIVRDSIREMAWMWRTMGTCDASLFCRFASLIAKRVRFRAFFRRYKPRFFWGRDDYSLDHIIRNQELRKHGGTSLGTNHGMPISPHVGMWREVDFDIYYTYGSHLYDTAFKQTWHPNVKIKPVGTLNLTQARREKLKMPRPRDIAFLPVQLQPFDEIFHEVFKVARHFPDRLVFVRMKPAREPHYMERYKVLMADAPSNIVAHIERDPYDLLTTVSYAVAFTTLVAEALQFGVRVFTLDMSPELKNLYYRAFPKLIVPDGETIIRRIENIEAGRETYDFDSFKDLIALDVTDPFEVIRRDLGVAGEVEQTRVAHAV